MNPLLEHIVAKKTTRMMKWLLSVSIGIFVLAFEFLRHALMLKIYMDWGNLLVALFSSVLFLIYFSFVFKVIEKLSDRMTEEKAEIAILAEREAMARKLHDNLAQSLFFMNIQAQGVEKLLREKNIPCPQVAELKEAIQLMDRDIRDNIFLLKELRMQSQHSLSQSIEKATKALKSDHDIQLALSIPPHFDKEIQPSLKYKIISMLREIFINIRKHANADRVAVAVAVEGDGIILCVEDNGCGIKDEDLAKPNSFGLRGVKNDVDALGGEMLLSNAPGSVITIRLPGSF